MAESYNLFKVNALPATPVVNSFYYVSDPSNQSVFTLYAIGTVATEVRKLVSSGVAETTITTVSTTSLPSNDINVLVNSTLSDYDIMLPPVVSNATVKLYMIEGNNRVTVKIHSGDSSGILVGSDSFYMDKQWDTIQLKALGNKWFIL